MNREAKQDWLDLPRLEEEGQFVSLSIPRVIDETRRSRNFALSVRLFSGSMSDIAIFRQFWLATSG